MADAFTVDASRALGGPEWLVERRVRAAERLASMSWPTPQEEIWRYSRIDELDLDRFRPVPPDQLGQPGELGDYIQLGKEGFDNDRDGRVNEDTIGYVDPNRTWGFSWEPEYVQSGAGRYPLFIPETRAIAITEEPAPSVPAPTGKHLLDRRG